ncbi:MAG: YdcF family protein [Burkholderiaceae bacterium]
MDAIAWVKAVVKALVLPPAGPLLLVFAGLLLARWRWRRAGGWIAALGALSLWLLSLPAVAAWLLASLSPTQPVSLEAARHAQAIVILGGGVRRNALEYGGDTLGRLTLERVRYGARLARELRLPVLVSGGSVKSDTRTEADLMREALVGEWGVPVRWLEDTSRNTHENAMKSAEILRREGISRVVLVVHGFDVPRVAAEFAEAGLQPVMAPTQLVRLDGPWLLGDFLPGARSLEDSSWVIYEWCGLLARKL